MNASVCTCKENIDAPVCIYKENMDAPVTTLWLQQIESIYNSLYNSFHIIVYLRITSYIYIQL